MLHWLLSELWNSDVSHSPWFSVQWHDTQRQWHSHNCSSESTWWLPALSTSTVCWSTDIQYWGILMNADFTCCHRLNSYENLFEIFRELHYWRWDRLAVGYFFFSRIFFVYHPKYRKLCSLKSYVSWDKIWELFTGKCTKSCNVWKLVLRLLRNQVTKDNTIRILAKFPPLYYDWFTPFNYLVWLVLKNCL